MEQVPDCPACRIPMQLRRVIPGVVGHPELRTYRCNKCGVVKTERIETKKEE